MAHQVDVRDSGDWGSCEAGELSKLSGHLRAEHARKMQGRAAGGILAAAMAVLAVAYLPMVGASPKSGWDLSCGRCVELMPAYSEHLSGLAAMPAEDAEAVRLHLEVCPKCREHYKADFPAATPDGEAIGLLENAWLMPAPRG